MKILLIEDELHLREDVLDMLSYEGYTAIGAENGQQGVEMAIEQLPDLIICDIMMPILDGYGTLTALRQHPQTANIPFVFLTARTTRADVRRGMELGADDYLTKPFTHAELMTAIRTRLEKRATLEKNHLDEIQQLRHSLVRALPHQIRTPLNGILGYASLLIEDLNNLDLLQIREMAEGIQKQGYRLHLMVENYLLYAQAELILANPEQLANLRQERLQHWDMILSEAIEQKAKQHEAPPAALLLPSQPKPILAIGVESFGKIVYELLDNAYRFSPPGSLIQVECQLQGPYLCLQVHNEGAGLSASQLSALEQDQHFVDQLLGRESIGMGLMLSKRLVEIYQGRFEVDSRPGDYTRIRLCLPVAISAEEKPKG